jgi:CrcB protein
VINLTACVIIGFSLTYLGKHIELSPAWRFLVPIGFIGAYSTFSTYEWETLSTLRSGAFALAALYAVGSLVAGLAAVWCGAALAETIS